jgi:hypothetical protein
MSRVYPTVTTPNQNAGLLADQKAGAHDFFLHKKLRFLLF